MQGSARKDVVFGQRGCILSPYQGQNGNPGLVHTAKISLEPGDRALMTTDGVHGSLSDENLAKIVGKRAGTRKALDRLVRAALRAGSRDNLTAVLIEFSAA